jgi:hypothetical protein
MAEMPQHKQTLRAMTVSNPGDEKSPGVFLATGAYSRCSGQGKSDPLCFPAHSLARE